MAVNIGALYTFGMAPEQLDWGNMEESNPILFEGQVFTSHPDICKTIKKYESVNHVNLGIKDSRKLGTRTGSKMPLRNPNIALVYSDIEYKCIHGGHYRNERKKHVLEKHRRKTKTFKLGCPFKIHFYISKDEQSLILKKFINGHNHPVDELIHKRYPKQRKLHTPTSDEIKWALSMQASKKKIQEDLYVKGYNVKSRDLQTNKGSNSFDDVCQVLTEYPGLTYDVLCEKNECAGIFFQTPYMKKTFEAYSALIFIDSTYKLNKLRMPLYIIMCVGGNGESEVVALAFVKNENKETLSWIANTFTSQNPNFQNVKGIMTDKDMTERSVFKNYFPNAALLICAFHRIHFFKREITKAKLIITAEERESLIDIVRSIVFAPDNDSYETRLISFKEAAPSSLIEYFMKNWDPIKDEFFRGLQSQFSKYDQNTNKWLESLNGKVKSVLKEPLPLTHFICDFMTVIGHYEAERNFKAIDVLIKRPTQICETADLVKYRNLLTPYAYERVEAQESLINKVKIIEKINQEAFLIETVNHGHIIVSSYSCPCGFRTSWSLPCRHIFKVRGNFGLSIYEENLCSERWFMRYYTKHQRLLSNIPTPGINMEFANNDEIMDDVCSTFDEIENFEKDSSNVPNITILPKCKPKTEIEKFSKAREVTDEICQHLSHLGTREWEEKLEKIKKILILTAENVDFEIVPFKIQTQMNIQDI